MKSWIPCSIDPYSDPYVLLRLSHFCSLTSYKSAYLHCEQIDMKKLNINFAIENGTGVVGMIPRGCAGGRMDTWTLAAQLTPQGAA